MAGFKRVAVEGVQASNVEKDTKFLLQDMDGLARGLGKLVGKLQPRFKALEGKGSDADFRSIQDELHKYMKANGISL